MNSSIDLRLTFWYVRTGTPTCVQQLHLHSAQCVFVLKIVLAVGSVREIAFHFIYFSFTATYF